VNIHGRYHFVTAGHGRELRVVVAGPLTIVAGDPVEFLPFVGQRPPDAVALKVATDGPLTDAEKKFFTKLTFNGDQKKHLLSPAAQGFTVTLDRETTLPMGSLICSGNRSGNGFVVKGCDFGYNRSRGILIKAGRGQVVGNKIRHTWGPAIAVAPEYWWTEAASSSDVVIADNAIDSCRFLPIGVDARGGDGSPLPAGAHRNIAITGNTITASSWPNISVTSTAGLVIQGNHLVLPEPTAFTPPLTRFWVWKGAKPAAVVVEQCSQVRNSQEPPP
jgi:hypothetical protein